MPDDWMWFSDATNLAFLLAILVAFAFFVFALRRRDNTPDPTDPSAKGRTNQAFNDLIENGVSFWNDLRKQKKYPTPDFSEWPGEDFQREAKGSRIWGVSVDLDNEPRLLLRGVNFDNVILNGCNLERADLRNASLINARLQDAHLEHAVLSYANLANADLRGAHLTGAVLTDALLPEANLAKAKVGGANFSWANLRGAILDTLEIEGLDLFGARLANATFDGRKARWLIFGRNLLSRTPIIPRLKTKS
jgi:hypothetical protein